MLFAIADSTTTNSFLNSDILADMGTLLTQVTSWITGNTYLSVFFTMSLIAVGCGLFRVLKRILRG